MTDKKNLINQKLKSVLTYQQLKELTEKNVRIFDPDSLNEMERAYYEYRKLNLARMSRLEKLYKPTDEALRVISKINSKLIWLVITEDWCGDSAQTIPVIASLALLNENIELKFLLRDENPDIMDLYLTKGKRSIPKLIVYDNSLNEIFLWGPRPSAAKEIAEELHRKGVDKQEISKQIHLWYAKDGGYTTEKEIIDLIESNFLKNFNKQSFPDILT